MAESSVVLFCGPPTTEQSEKARAENPQRKYQGTFDNASKSGPKTVLQVINDQKISDCVVPYE